MKTARKACKGEEVWLKIKKGGKKNWTLRFSLSLW